MERLNRHMISRGLVKGAGAVKNENGSLLRVKISIRCNDSISCLFSYEILLYLFVS